MRKGIVIELTSLLDVILIILFMILASIQQSGQQAEAKAEEAAASAQQAEAAASEAREEAEHVVVAYNMMDETCGIVTITIDADARAIEVSDGDASQTIALAWDNTLYARNLFRTTIANMVAQSFEAGKQGVFLMFQYDSTKIYRADYELVRDVIQQQAGEGVYIAEYDIQGE